MTHYKGFCLAGGVCLTSFPAHMICLSVRHDQGWSSYFLCRGRNGLKGLKGSPLTHINKHSHSWPPILPHCKSLTHKRSNTSEVPPHPHHHQPLLLLPHDSPTPANLPLFENVISASVPCTFHTHTQTDVESYIHTAYVSTHKLTDAYCKHSRARADTLSPSLTHKIPGRGRGQHNSSHKNAEEVYVAIGKGERHLGLAQMSNYPFQRTQKKGPFSGNVPPTNISPCSRRNTATFALNGQTLICQTVMQQECVIFTVTIFASTYCCSGGAK